MTAKRFKLSMMSQYGSYSGVSDEDKEYTSDEIVDLLNQLNEENEQLKENCKNYQWYKQCKQLLNENGQLKHSIKCLEADKMELQQYIKRMQGDVE